jgi:hypothetical protein
LITHSRSFAVIDAKLGPRPTEASDAPKEDDTIARNLGPEAEDEDQLSPC